ncbi:MAG: segregation/condensation protein A [Clostridia bacterium]|nr:segregation/condensation protein A [Clostridia bacterium]
MSEALTYKIDTFEGPLDLLLALISKNKMEIADIRITVIFEQYMAYLDRMKQMDMEIAGEFIVMASELMLIKSRMLLPKADNPEEEDPRARLAAALLAYRQAKEAAAYLEEQYSYYSARYVKDEDEVPVDSGDIAQHDILLLQKALARLFSKKDTEAPPPINNINPIIKKTIVPVSDKIREVAHRLSAQGTTPFLQLFDRAESKSEIVALFMAVLSLAKDGYLLLEKRLAAAVPEDESALWDNVEDYRYEFYCTLNPEQVISEDYVGLYEETGDRGGDPDADHDNKEGAHAQ